jgi:hypothetical protein
MKVSRIIEWFVRNVLYLGRMPEVPDIHELKNPDFDKPLLQMEQLLRRGGASGHADILIRVIGQLQSDLPKALKFLCDGNFWGASGSFFDLQFYADGPNTGDPDRDNREYSGLLLQVLQNLLMEGCRVPGHRWMKGFLRNVSEGKYEPHS